MKLLKRSRKNTYSPRMHETHYANFYLLHKIGVGFLAAIIATFFAVYLFTTRYVIATIDQAHSVKLLQYDVMDELIKFNIFDAVKTSWEMKNAKTDTNPIKRDPFAPAALPAAPESASEDLVIITADETL